MKKLLTALGACGTLSILPMGASAHGADASNAVLGGLVGSSVVTSPVYAAPAPVRVRRYAPPPVVVEEYAPARVIVERRTPSMVVYKTRPYHRHRRHHHARHHEYRHDRYDRGWNRHHWDND